MSQSGGSPNAGLPDGYPGRASKSIAGFQQSLSARTHCARPVLAGIREWLWESSTRSIWLPL